MSEKKSTKNLKEKIRQGGSMIFLGEISLFSFGLSCTSKQPKITNKTNSFIQKKKYHLKTTSKSTKNKNRQLKRLADSKFTHTSSSSFCKGRDFKA
jgi:hypothetical protein